MRANPSTWSARSRTAFLALGLGLATLLVTLGMILLVSNDMRWILAVGAITLFTSALWLGSRRRGGPIGLLLLCGPLLVGFGLLVLPQLPGLWPHVVAWLGSALIGWIGFRARRRSKAPAIAALLAVATFGTWYGAVDVPREISGALNRQRDDPAPEFALERLDGRPFDMASLEGKVVVLDFFATWCAPCIAELPELEAVRRDLAGRDDVVILVIANDSGGETPATIRAFVDAREIELPFVYDPGGVAHSAFGFSGLPGLVVIDRERRIRLTREGYNAAESGFRGNLVELLETL